MSSLPTLPSFNAQFNLNGLNIFISVDDSYSIMFRIDSTYYCSDKDNAQLTFYNIVCDPVAYDNNLIHCVSVANHPTGGFGYFQQIAITKNALVHKEMNESLNLLLLYMNRLLISVYRNMS